ncbi:CWC24 [[Candida] subhashii]|uniref:Pre-mRNA-splicing factor CWC24 n=1 Tax=[Candida] subhashii TaxID=561895 RepID=A0A8J5QPQ5_9ASCO|nr:CWC24 [[Candida] subhashii]KAG7663412.1 CWC24 [[Candida] subhashii]
MFKKRTVKTKDNDNTTKRKLKELEEDHDQDDPTPIEAITKKPLLRKSSNPPSIANQIRRSRTPSKQNTPNIQEDAESLDTDAAKPTNSNRSIIKAPPKNINITTITDFQPDVCKDFWQTGYCGYGDTCKFLHIRDESRQKKPVEKDWENVITKPLKQDKQQDEIVPFKCVICKQDYKFPIKTSCGHLFCKACFLDRFKQKKKSGCFICGQDTNGVMIPISKTELDTLIA